MQVSARILVELDIFSGRPNPTWLLTTAEAESFGRRLAALRRSSPCEISSRLGYRGLIVDVAHGTQARLVRVQSGCVQIVEDDTTAHAHDEERELERWLIETGRPHLMQDVIEIVERGLR